MSGGMSLHVASGRFTSVLNPKQIVGFVPGQDVRLGSFATGLSQYQARPCPSAPEVLEPARRQLGVSHGVLDFAVAEVSLQRPGIVHNGPEAVALARSDEAA